MTQSPRRPPPIAVAVEWVAKITTVALEMVLPAVASGYLDRRLGTRYWVLVGLVVGMVTGLYHLLQMVRKPEGRLEKQPQGRFENQSRRRPKNQPEGRIDDRSDGHGEPTSRDAGDGAGGDAKGPGGGH